MITIVYHIYCVGQWNDIVQEQLRRVKDSGLYDATDLFFVTAIDPNSQFQAELDAIKALYPKIDVEVSTLNGYEYAGIKKVWDICQRVDTNVLYFHAKGVSNTYRHHSKKDELYEPKVRRIREWRHCLEWFLLDKWSQCTDLLKTYDNVGVTCNNGWFWGNFWWSKSEFIRQRSAPSHGDRWYFEAWLNMGMTSKNYEWWHFDFNPYLTDFPQFYYDKSVDLASQKIELLSASYGEHSMQVDEGCRPVYEDAMLDITEKVRKMIDSTDGKALSLYCSNQLVDDKPLTMGDRKFMIATFRLNSQTLQLAVNEGMGINFDLRKM